MQEKNIQQAALAYARAAEPIDSEMGWRREDIEAAFVAGEKYAQLSLPDGDLARHRKFDRAVQENDPVPSLERFQR